MQALAERQGVAMDVAIYRMTALAERELRFAELEAAMAANPLDDCYLAEFADRESEAWSRGRWWHFPGRVRVRRVVSERPCQTRPSGVSMEC